MSSAPSFTGAVLAGGESRRMGRDKAGLAVDGVPLWQRQVSILRAAGAGVVGVVRRPGQPALDLPPDVPLWTDAVIGAGPLAGLEAALAASPTDLVAVVATDLPRIQAAWFTWLLGQAAPGRGVVARHPDGPFEPLAAIYPKSALPEVTRRLATADRSLQSLIASLVATEHLLPIALAAPLAPQLANWNTPDDTR